MKHPTLVFLIKNPNHTIQLATQQHLKDRLLIQCSKCSSVIVAKNKMFKIACSKCNTINAINSEKNIKKCKNLGCKGQITLVNIGRHIVKQCNICSKGSLIRQIKTRQI